MATIEFGPATADDFRQFTQFSLGRGHLPPMRVRAFSGKINGHVIGIGGIAFHANGTREAFCELTEEARRHPVALHKAAVTTLKLAKELRIKRLIAMPDPSQTAAERWLIRLGFTPFEADGNKVYVHAAT